MRGLTRGLMSINKAFFWGDAKNDMKASSVFGVNCFVVSHDVFPLYEIFTPVRVSPMLWG